MTTGKTIVLTIQTFVSKVISLLFNMLSRLVIAFIPRIKYLLISWLQSPSSDFGTQENKICCCFHFFSIYLPWSCGTRCHDLNFFHIEFQASSPLSLSSRDSSSSLLSVIRVVSSAYLRLLIFFPAILIPACSSSSPAFHMMCSAYKLNKQGDNIQPCRILFSILN